MKKFNLENLQEVVNMLKDEDGTPINLTLTEDTPVVLDSGTSFRMAGLIETYMEDVQNIPGLELGVNDGQPDIVTVGDLTLKELIGLQRFLQKQCCCVEEYFRIEDEDDIFDPYDFDYTDENGNTLDWYELIGNTFCKG